MALVGESEIHRYVLIPCRDRPLLLILVWAVSVVCVVSVEVCVVTNCSSFVDCSFAALRRSCSIAPRCSPRRCSPASSVDEGAVAVPGTAASMLAACSAWASASSAVVIASSEPPALLLVRLGAARRRGRFRRRPVLVLPGGVVIERLYKNYVARNGLLTTRVQINLSPDQS